MSEPSRAGRLAARDRGVRRLRSPFRGGVVLALGLVLPAPCALAEEARAEREEIGATLVVEGERGVADRDLVLLERQLVVAFTQLDESCPLRLVDIPRLGSADAAQVGEPAREPSAEAEEREAPLELRLHVEYWRERNLPGGAPVFDPNTGRDRQGFRREVELRYRLSLHGDEEGAPPLYDREQRARAVEQTMRNPAFRPEVEARRRALSQLVVEVRRAACAAAEELLEELLEERSSKSER